MGLAMLNELKLAIDRAGAAARDVGMIAAAIERSATDPECVAICAQLLNMAGEYRDRLSAIRLDVLERVQS